MSLETVCSVNVFKRKYKCLVDRYLGGLLVVVRALGLNRMAKDDGGAPWSSCWARWTQIMPRERCWERTTEEETTGRKILQPIIRFILKFNVKSVNPTLPETFQKYFPIVDRSNSPTTKRFQLGSSSQSDGDIRASIRKVFETPNLNFYWKSWI